MKGDYSDPESFTSGRWLVSGLSAVDRGLALYWKVRKMVFDQRKERARLVKEKMGTNTIKKYVRDSSQESHEHRGATRGSQHSKTFKQSLPAILEDEELSCKAWSRQQGQHKTIIGGKAVVRRGSYPQHVWYLGI